MKFLIGFIAACALWLVVLFNIDVPEVVVYDCNMAEWHPDIPKEVKEECRRMKATQNKSGVWL